MLNRKKLNNLLNSADFFLKLIKARIFHQRTPLSVIYNITDRCNLRCEYCYAGYHQRCKQEPTKEQIFSTIDQLVNMGAKRISLSGGEPLLRDDIGEIIDYVKSKNILCTLNSNGLLVPAKIGQIKNADVLCLSMDGTEEQHDYYRGQGSFRGVTKAIDCALADNMTLYINTVLHSKNLDSIDFIMELAKEKGIWAEFAVLIGHIYEDDDKSNLRKATDEEYRRAIKKIIDYKKRNYPVVMSEKAYKYVSLWGSFKKEDFKKDEIPAFPYVKCSMAGRYFCCIDTDGIMYACPHLIGKQPSINCYNVSVKDAFKNMPMPDCQACYQVYHNEFNLLFNLDLEVILNYTKIFKK